MGIEPNEGLIELLAIKVGKTAFPGGGWSLMLFSNALSPSQATVFADLTESTWGGYSRVSLSPGTWTTPVLVVDHTETTYGTVPIQWTVSSGPTETVYGWAIIDSASHALLYVERFDVCDQFVANIGAILQLLATLTEGTRGCP